MPPTETNERYRWEFFITGEACEEMNRSEKDANNMEIVFSGAVGDWIRRYKTVSCLYWLSLDEAQRKVISCFSPCPVGDAWPQNAASRQLFPPSIRPVVDSFVRMTQLNQFARIGEQKGCLTHGRMPRLIREA